MDGSEVVVTIDGEYMRSIVAAYNGSLQYTQFAPILEVYERDGCLYACDWDLPKEHPFEFKLEADRCPNEIKVTN